MFGGVPISWSSRKQTLVSLSTAECEYQSLSEIGREVTWLRNLIEQLGYKQKGATVVDQDCTASISWSYGNAQFRKVGVGSLHWRWSSEDE